MIVHATPDTNKSVPAIWVIGFVGTVLTVPGQKMLHKENLLLLSRQIDCAAGNANVG